MSPICYSLQVLRRQQHCFYPENLAICSLIKQLTPAQDDKLFFCNNPGQHVIEEECIIHHSRYRYGKTTPKLLLFFTIIHLPCFFPCQSFFRHRYLEKKQIFRFGKVLFSQRIGISEAEKNCPREIILEGRNTKI